ncbi:Shedu anti-phage system protein SduA domain-containing protein [Micromonospora sp. NPDC049175]|uniref:Shedu anti-phage system protein SduA domain-containing protein n=1 Tax=Micromonospora sp. NPDC049175 TaxID=3364266 RepID=UPI0037143D3E
MEIRADWALELQLEQTEKIADRQEVKAALAATRGHLISGGRSRKGGRELLTFLGDARYEAAMADEWQVVRLLQDSIDYAEGRITKHEFEERYRLFQDGAARDSGLLSTAANIVAVTCEFAARQGRAYLDANPDASAEQILTQIRSLGEDSKLMEAPEDRPGRYRIVRGSAERMLWLERVIRSGRLDVEDARDAARSLAMSPEAMAILAADTEGRLIFRAVELQVRAAGLKELRRVIEDPEASEHEIQRSLQGHLWIFGGRFVGEAAHRRLVPGDEMDIPLIRGDGALHVVELKLSMKLDGALVKKHRNAWVPSSKVHDAVGQAVNYLVGLDENRERIRREFGIETRRTSAVVLIGHPALQPDVPEEEINETLRTYNTHLNRVEVLTYKELVDSAERSLGGSLDGAGGSVEEVAERPATIN